MLRGSRCHSLRRSLHRERPGPVTPLAGQQQGPEGTGPRGCKGPRPGLRVGGPLGPVGEPQKRSTWVRPCDSGGPGPCPEAAPGWWPSFAPRPTSCWQDRVGLCPQLPSSHREEPLPRGRAVGCSRVSHSPELLPSERGDPWARSPQPSGVPFSRSHQAPGSQRGAGPGSSRHGPWAPAAGLAPQLPQRPGRRGLGVGKRGPQVPSHPPPRPIGGSRPRGRPAPSPSLPFSLSPSPPPPPSPSPRGAPRAG